MNACIINDCCENKDILVIIKRLYRVTVYFIHQLLSSDPLLTGSLSQ